MNPAPVRSLVRPVPGILGPARERADLTYRELRAKIAETGPNLSLGTLTKVLVHDRPVEENTARALADAVGVPFVEAFTHMNGDPVGGTL